MHVVATAGHVDHGKSTLVRALTGREPDRLEEERRRGLTIELGFAWTRLDPVGDVAFVDVPGHERFVATALTGLGPVPVVLFVVAADDPWMPQAEEHLAALDALGVRHGVLVVTRSDLAAPSPALAVARDRLGATTLADAPHVAVSATTGAGLEELRATLAAVLAEVPAPDPAAPVRLWVDRRFTVRGAGTVVTGTLPDGTVRVGDALATADGGLVRVRGLQSLETDRAEVSGTARVALNLTGDVDGLGRGDSLVTPGAWWDGDVLDVRVGDDVPLPREPVVHVGTATLGVQVRPLGPGFARVRLSRRLPWHVGDRLLLRDPGRRRVVGAAVVDPDPPRLAGRGGAAARVRVLTADDGTPAAELSRRGLLHHDDLVRLGHGSPPREVLQVGAWLLDPSRAEQVRADLAAGADASGAAGWPTAEAARRLGVPDEVVVALVEPPVTVRAGRLHAGTGLPDDLATVLGALRSRLAEAPFDAPDVPWLREHGLDAAGIAVLTRDGHVVRLAEGVVVLPDAVDTALVALAELPAPFTTSEARAALGASRRVALALLGHLDRTGRTVRQPDDRRRLRGP